MIEERDIELFIKAKRDQRAIDFLLALSFVALSILIGLEAFGQAHDYTIPLATSSAVFMGMSMGKSRWVAVSRGQLINSLERIINNDPDALKTLASKRQNGTLRRKPT